MTILFPIINEIREGRSPSVDDRDARWERRKVRRIVVDQLTKKALVVKEDQGPKTQPMERDIE